MYILIDNLPLENCKMNRFDLSSPCKNKTINISPDIGLEADALSISQQKSVSSLLEMILALGVLPNMLQGVGSPLHKRSQFLQLLLRVGFIEIFSD